jgi:hypothetical protein
MVIGKEQMETALRDPIFPPISHFYGERDLDEAGQVHLAGTHVLYVDKNAMPHMLPWITISGISLENVKKGKKRNRG